MDEQPPLDVSATLARLKAIQARMRAAIVSDMRRSSDAQRSAVAFDGAGDTIYAIDRSIEHILLEECRAWSETQPFVLVAEGLGETGEMRFGRVRTGALPLRVIFDPLDGTRGLMYDKRSAWILAAVAVDRGPQTALDDVVLAVQTEAPTTKQYLADVLWAVRGQGAHAERHNLLTGEIQPMLLSPSRSSGLAHGFASLSKFFPGRKPVVAEIEEALIKEIDGPTADGKVRVFDDPIHLHRRPALRADRGPRPLQRRHPPRADDGRPLAGRCTRHGRTSLRHLHRIDRT